MLPRWVGRAPIVRDLRRAASDRRFEHNTRSNLFRGVFTSFAEAQASAPATRPIGYDNPQSANLYLERLHIDEYDYPSMFWIAASLGQGMRQIADIGGSVGIKYFAFRGFIDYPADIVWRVIDVPAVIARGAEFAAANGASPALQFSDRLADADGMDLFFVSGALQYLPESLPEMLDRIPNKPGRIVINTTPIHAVHSFFTLNSIGTAFCPYRVQAHDEFVAAMNRRGYRVRDEWLNVGKRMQIAFEPEYSLSHYTGFCFDAGFSRSGHAGSS
jgi:putative methyltransferase (TIGR04325 family)